MRQLARVALAKSPTLVEKICDFSTRAGDAYTKRNVIVHGFWFDMTLNAPERGVMIMTRADGKGDFYSVTTKEIEALAEKIGGLKLEGIMLMFPPTGNNQPFLTPDELSVLQEYHADFPGPAQESLIPRDPARKGTPQRPEPFRA
jgi:hypothetical protein